MPITVLTDVIMPNSLIVAGLSGRNIRNNTRSVNQAGFANINVNWSRPLREFEIGYIPSLPSVWQTIEGLWEITKGGAFGFLMEDPKDSGTTAAQGALQAFRAGANLGAIGFGHGEPVYRLFKRYAAYGATQIDDRNITHPRLPLSALTLAAVPVVIGAAPGNAAIGALGIVTFVAAETQSVTAITPGVTTSVTLNAGIGLVNGGRLWLEGMTGAGAGLLNNRSHAITALAGNVYTLSTNTLGAAINSSGSGSRFPQPTQALAWSGNFLVPVHFASDELQWQLERGGAAETRLISGQSIVLREVRQ